MVRIRLHPTKPYQPLDEAVLFRTVRGAFEQRRKTLPNALSAVFGELTKEEITECITACGHSAEIRGEKLGIEEFVSLSDYLYQKYNQNPNSNTKDGQN